MTNTHTFKVGDVVTGPPRGGARHRSTGVIVKIKKKAIIVQPMPDHPKNSVLTYKPHQLRYWLKGNRNRNQHK